MLFRSIKISEFLGVSVYYLLTGSETTIGDLPAGSAVLIDSGNAYLTADDEKTEEELLRMFRSLSDFNKGRILGIMEAITEQLYLEQ